MVYREKKFPAIAKVLSKLKLRSTILDGDWPGDAGRPRADELFRKLTQRGQPGLTALRTAD
jgi:hypothetical protein